ncbi:MFS transporter [Lactobacillus sp. ESL0791]|uniref:MFS transporter n=1 Tax=Lactobacillus sp. ESL0791 TaxID=2983234 RepID=UPI0023F7FBC4|nr:MFS transporter [Lactobacillus sp. ESL0791]MDF7639892.1 MFS transporter [Lactobacillus sp. ESL0791]
MKTNKELSAHQRLRLTTSLYLNYLVHGFSLIIIAQNMSNLSHTFNTTIAQISFIMSGTGIGRLLGYLLTAYLSDRYSRKTTIVSGMICYLLFAWGVILSPNLTVLYLITALAGLGNSLLDAGTYTTLVEINHGEGYATILIKGFASIGEFILPLLVSVLQQNRLWYGWSFVIMGILILINMLLLVPIKFPNMQVEIQEEAQKASRITKTKNIVLTVLLSIYGYISMALMIWFTQWITIYGKETLHYSNIISHGLMSAYSLGSMLGVISLYILSRKKVSNTKLLISCNGIALIAMTVVLISKQSAIVNLASLIFGFSSAGGVMQIGLTVLMNLHPAHRGLMTSLFYLFGSFASISVPIISGQFSKVSLHLALGADWGIALLATIISCLIALILRQKQSK